MLNTISRKLTENLIKSGKIGENRRELYEYGFFQFFELVINITTIVIITVLSRQYIASVFFFAAFIPLRNIAGGFHLNSPLACYFFSTAIVVFAVCSAWIFPSNIHLILGIIFIAISVFFIYLFAPFSHPNKPATLEEQKRYKKLSRIIIIVYAAIFTALIFISLTAAFSLSLGACVASCLLAITKIKKKKENLS